MNTKLKHKIACLKASIQGALDGLELDRLPEDDVIEISLVLAQWKDMLSLTLEIQRLNATLLPTPEEIQAMAEKSYPLADARKVMMHDNNGQYSRREAYVKGIKDLITKIKNNE